jgi:hypothetical protein
MFGPTAGSLGAALPLTVMLGFVLGGGATFVFQTRAGDSRRAAALKALAAGALVAVPFPIFGTMIGGIVAAQSGISSIRDKALGGQSAAGRPDLNRRSSAPKAERPVRIP